jgi:hypothetical protein
MIKPVKQGSFHAGKDAKGEEVNLTYDVYDYSGLDNDHVFTGTIQGQPETAFTPEPSAPPDSKEYTQANHQPQAMDQSPNPPRGHSDTD